VAGVGNVLREFAALFAGEDSSRADETMTYLETRSKLAYRPVEASTRICAQASAASMMSLASRNVKKSAGADFLSFETFDRIGINTSFHIKFLRNFPEKIASSLGNRAKVHI
jgi:hypothetical protein